MKLYFVERQRMGIVFESLLLSFYLVVVMNCSCLFNSVFMTISECTDDLFRKN